MSIPKFENFAGRLGLLKHQLQAGSALVDDFKGDGYFDIVLGDGQEDVIAQFGGLYRSDRGFPSLYLNPGGNTNKWIGLKLEGVRANHAAIGSRVHLTLKTSQGKRDIYRIVSPGGSFGANPLELHIGLGGLTTPVILRLIQTPDIQLF